MLCNDMRHIILRHPLRQALGLMFQRPRRETLYLFDFGKRVHYSFHMWFVLGAIDLFLLDERGTVREVKRRFFPFTAYWPATTYHLAIECAPGTLDAQVGDRVPLPDGVPREHNP